MKNSFLNKKILTGTILVFSISCSSNGVNQVKNSSTPIPTKSESNNLNPLQAPTPAPTSITPTVMPSIRPSDLPSTGQPITGNSGQILLNGSAVPTVVPTYSASSSPSNSTTTITSGNDVIIPKPSITSYPTVIPTQVPIKLFNRGERILFTSKDNDISQIFSVKIDGADQKKLSLEQRNQSMATFSNDASKIFFVNTLVDSFNDIYKVNQDGNNLERITTLAQKLYYPKVSNTGKLIYINQNQLYLLESDGLFQLTQSQDKISYGSWNTNNQISFLSLNGNNYIGNVYLINDDGSNFTNVTGSGLVVAFDMKNNFIAFSDFRGIWIATYQGNSVETTKKQIYTDGFVTQIALSPDNNYIAFTSSKSGKKQIYTIKTDGTELKQITNGEESFDPSW